MRFLEESPSAMDRKFGAHMSIAGGLDRSIQAAEALGFRSVQLFTKSTNQWNALPLTSSQIDGFQKALRQSRVEVAVVHTSYLINIASPDESLRAKSVDSLTMEVERCALLGIEDLVLHPGAHMGEGEEAGLRRAAMSLDEVHRRLPGSSLKIDLETTAGQGTCLGSKIEHLGTIFDLVKEPDRLGVCCDTCHLFAAGYLFASQDAYDKLMDSLDLVFGLGRIRVWHLNDSQRDLGSRVDRHAGIGRGRMGVEPFRFVVNDSRFSEIPFILETPKGQDPITGADLDAVNRDVLLGLKGS